MAVVGAETVLGGSDRPTVTMVIAAWNRYDELMVEGLDRAALDFDFEPVVLKVPLTDLDDQLAAVAESGADLVLFTEYVFFGSVLKTAKQYPDITWAGLTPGDITAQAHRP